MNRREALSGISLSLGLGILVPSSLLLSCQNPDYQVVFFEIADIPLLDEIGETILPNTSSSLGAKSTKIGNFMDAYVKNCFSPENQIKIKEGLATLKETCKIEMGKDFLKLPAEKRHQFLVALDGEANKKSIENEIHYFKLFKNLVLLGYFTSEEGATKSLRYLPVPGRYEGNYPLQSGDKAWAL